MDDDGALLAVACGNAACTQPERNTIDFSVSGLSSAGVRPSSIAIGQDGFALISYVTTSAAVNVAKCSDATCHSHPNTTTITPSGVTATDTSVAIGVDGFGLVAYGGDSLAGVHWSNAACSSSTQINLTGCTSVCNSGGTPPGGDSIAITVGDDGLALIAHHFSGKAGIAHCSDIACGTGTTSVLDGPQQTDVGLNGWLTLEPDGHALMVYRDSTAGTLKAARCGDAA